jgi:hypothetical protein
MNGRVSPVASAGRRGRPTPQAATCVAASAYRHPGGQQCSTETVLACTGGKVARGLKAILGMSR